MVGQDQYTIGWVCAILPELTAARLHLDEEHDAAEFESSPGDDNTYVLGSIGKHNVVVATLPHGEHGTSSAAAVAKDMIRSFPSLRVVLMVGIGGGVPVVAEDQTNGTLKIVRDIRLGDIVVSAPRDGIGGVLQPDLGKALPDGDFQRTSHLNQPPRSLLTAVQLLTSDLELHGQTIESDIAAKLGSKPGLKRYQHPDPTTDRLFRSSFVHVGASIEDCSLACAQHSEQLIDRPSRDQEPHIHYGLIASSNTLVKDAKLRDALGTAYNVLCIEMEAAGLMNQLPALVIRGISDYADSHKNDSWQGYASMTAAAYARMLLLKVTASRVGATQKLSEMNGVREQLQDISGDIKQSNVIQQELLDLHKKQNKVDLQAELTKWLHSPEQSIHRLPEEHRQDIVFSMQFLIRSKVSITLQELTEAVLITNYGDNVAVPDSLTTVCNDVIIFTVERKFLTVTKVPYQWKTLYSDIPRTSYKSESRRLTFKEFSLHKGVHCLEGRLSPAVANLAIAKACLNCLLKSSSRKTVSSFDSYSAKYWITHYTTAASRDAALLSLALELLTPDTAAFRSWIAKYEFPPWVAETTCRCPLFLMALNGVFDLVGDLLKRDNSHRNHSCAAISAASSIGHIEIVKLLLNEKLGFGEQALDLAREGGHTEIFHLLSDNVSGAATELPTTMSKLDLA